MASEVRSRARARRRAGRRAEAALAREMRVSKALREVGIALGTTLDLDQLLELILDKITEALEADRATLYLLDETNDELVSRIAQGDDVRSIRLKIGHGIAGHVARTGKPLHVRDAYKDPRFSPEWDMLSGYRTRSILAAPMKNHLGQDHRRRAGAQQEARRVLRRRRRHPRGAGHAGGGEHRQLAPLHVGHAEEHPAPRHQGAARAPRARPQAALRPRAARWGARTSLEELFTRRAGRGDARVRGARWAPSRCAIPRRAPARSTSSTSAPSR